MGKEPVSKRDVGFGTELATMVIEKRAGLSCAADTAVMPPQVITAGKDAHSQDIQFGREAVHGGTA